VFASSARPRRVRRAALASLLGLASVAALAPTAAGALQLTCLPHCPPVVGSAYGTVLGAAPDWYLSASYNSQGGTNTVSNPALGQFLVNLPGLTASGGTANVTGEGDNCNVFGWTADQTAGTTLDVRCFDNTGAATNSPFTFTFTTQRQNNFPYAYAWVDDAQSATSVPNLTYQFDQGSTIKVRHPKVGRYTVSIPFSGYGPGGAAKVGAYGSNAWCAVVELVGTTPTERVRVKCVNPKGHAVDSQFTITFQRETDQLDQKTLASGYARIDPPAADGTFAPTGDYFTWNSTGGAVTAYKIQTGLYFVHFAGLTTLGDAQVTALTKTSNRCRVGDISEYSGTLTAEVVCNTIDNGAQWVDTPFLVQVTTTS